MVTQRGGPRNKAPRIKFSDGITCATKTAGWRRVEPSIRNIKARLRFVLGRHSRFTGGQGAPERLTLGPSTTSNANRLAGAQVDRSHCRRREPGRSETGACKGRTDLCQAVRQYVEKRAKQQADMVRGSNDTATIWQAHWAEDFSHRPRGRGGDYHAITRAGHPTVANRVKALTIVGLAHAVAGLSRNSPAKGSKATGRSRDRFLKPGELPPVRALDGEPNGNFRDYFLLALLTGARRNNVTMRWTDLDLGAAMGNPITKNSELARAVDSQAVAILKARQETAAGHSLRLPGRVTIPSWGIPAVSARHGCASGPRRNRAIAAANRSKGAKVDSDGDEYRRTRCSCAIPNG
jgi:hypothetical protein